MSVPLTDAPLTQGERSGQNNRTAADVPPVDLQTLEPLYAGDTAFQKELFETFITHSQTTVDEIQRASAEGHPDTVRQAAHSLKGAAGGICAEPLRAAAAALETAALEGRVDSSVAVLIERLRIEFSRTADFLRATLLCDLEQ